MHTPPGGKTNTANKGEARVRDKCKNRTQSREQLHAARSKEKGLYSIIWHEGFKGTHTVFCTEGWQISRLLWRSWFVLLSIGFRRTERSLGDRVRGECQNMMSIRYNPFARVRSKNSLFGTKRTDEPSIESRTCNQKKNALHSTWKIAQGERSGLELTLAVQRLPKENVLKQQ